MPYANHQRLTVRGTFGPDAVPYEEWTWSLNLSDADPTNQQYDQAALDDLAASVVSFHTDPESYMVAGARIREIKLARIGPDGTYRQDPIIKAVNVPGGQNIIQLPHPPQVALAVSLNTARRGATGRGRFYLPCPALSVDDEGVVPLIDINKIRARVGVMLNEMNNRPGFDVSAPKVTVASSKGYNSDVTSIRIGRALDTIRSRRRSINEAYSANTPVG